jgi:ABC-type nitrate/sulfonate/bicarbonate transport system substrate-binding protein
MNHIFTGLLLLGLTAFSSASAQPHTVRLALDWAPNTNHTGVFVAIAKGWYEAEGVELRLLPFGNISSNVLVTSGQAEVGISGTQGILSAAAIGEPVVAIAAIISTNTAALAVLEASDIESPRDLDGRIYAAFGGPIERPIIETVIQHDGGAGEFDSAVLGAAGFDALLSGRADFVWIYEGWQGIQAQREGVSLRLFNFNDYGIADHYNPLFVVSPEGVVQNAEALRAFLRATARGYTFAAKNPEEAARLLIETAPPGSFADPGLVYDSQAFVSQVYRKPDTAWGVQYHENWKGFTEFLLNAEVFTDADGRVVRTLDIDALYTNALLPESMESNEPQ